jgi:structural maintenance of chromosome 2
VLELIEIKDENFIKAIELGAGPKLTNIVVDDEQTSTHILSQKIFTNHSYLIPNSKVNEFKPKEELIRVAEQIASSMNGQCKPALQLISYKKEVARSMSFVFGNFFVASSIEIAQAVAYHATNTQRCKVVTRDGDTIDPSGTITGGYYNDKNQILPRVKELMSIKRKLEHEDERL